MRLRSGHLRAVILIGVVVGVSGTAPIQASPRSVLGVQVMPGGQVVGDRIVYEDGAVIVVPGGGGESFDSCPNGTVCLFQNTNWTGDMVQFSSCCAWDDLSNYGFNNIASSWRNRLSVDAQIADGSGGGSPRLCLNNGSYAGSMPSGWDDAASSIRVRDASSYC